MKITVAVAQPEFENPALSAQLLDCSAGHGSTIHPFVGANAQLLIVSLPLPELRRAHRSPSQLKVRAVYSEVGQVPQLHYFLCELEGTGLTPGACTWLRQTFAEVQELHAQLGYELREHHPFAKHAPKTSANRADEPPGAVAC